MFDKRVSNEVKGIAIILMLIHHLFYCLYTFCLQYDVNMYPLSGETMRILSQNGKVCVSMYVFIIAYGITKGNFAKKEQLSRNSINVSAINRCVKLWGNFTFIYLLTLCTVGLREKTLIEIYGGGWIGVFNAFIDLFGLRGLFGTPGLNETWWYMSLAFLLIFAVPLLNVVYDRYGLSIVVILGYFSYLMSNGGTSFLHYLFSVILGILMAESNGFDRIKTMKLFKIDALNSVIKVIFFLATIVSLYLLRDGTDLSCFIDPLFTICVCGLCVEVHNIPYGVNRITEFLGKHSMNIFLVHTLIFEYYFTEFIYSFDNWLFILLALLISSLLVSIVCECLKKFLRWDRMIFKITAVINQKNSL